MRIVLQHQFWGLKVSDAEFEVGLSFGGVAEKLVVPFAAVKDFEDPAVQFKLQFETLGEIEEGGGDAASGESQKTAEPRRRPWARKEPARSNVPASPPAEPASTVGDPDQPPPEHSGAEVVPLDRFRKK